jgi:hypothetical protein
VCGIGTLLVQGIDSVEGWLDLIVGIGGMEIEQIDAFRLK